MSSQRRHRKGDDDGVIDVFKNLDKTTIIQESRYFNSNSINPRKCSHILVKILYLMGQGEKLSTKEATDIFFATTKLFQSKDVMLRRIVYLGIKELSSTAQDVIIVTSSLTKDMTGKEDLYRAAAIRALCSITDPAMLQAIERYMKQAIVDKNTAISSAALVSALHLSATVPDLVKRWVNEAQDAVMSENAMVSYHALGVLSQIKRRDHLSMVKLVTKLSHSSLRSPFALCLLIRHSAKLASEDPESCGQYINFIEYCLRHKSEIIVYEAAHAMISLRNSAKDLAQALTVLQTFCGSSKATVRLAGVRSLAKFTAKHPGIITTCTADLEDLISDRNRSVATLAVTTLLATGTESAIDRLMKPMASFMSEISDEFKIIVVQAIRRLCSKYPHKYQTFATFLAGMLKDEGGIQYKSAIADAIIALIEENPDAKEIGLSHLCEFIEDCEHTSLAVKILHVLGREGPKAPQPSKYIRFIYNRVILESGPVRAAAVAAVARFGAAQSELLPNIQVLLARCQLDDDDEVRDRAILYSAILNSNDSNLINDYILKVQVPNMVILEKSLNDHLQVYSNELFDIATVPIEDHHIQVENIPAAHVEVARKPIVSLEEQYADHWKIIPGVEKLGSVFKTCEPIDLTESETEYHVRCVKHVFARHLILQFECLNTLSDQLLEKVKINLVPAFGYKILFNVSCEQLAYNKKGNVFCILEFPEILMETIGTFGATLEFTVRDCDPTTGMPDSGEGYADSYPLEDFDIGCAEQFRTRIASDDWEAAWERAASAAETCDTFGLAQVDVNEAAKAVCQHFGLPKAAISGDAVKIIRGGGIWRLGVPILIQARLVAAHGAVTMQLAVRSPREEVATLLLAAVA